MASAAWPRAQARRLACCGAEASSRALRARIANKVVAAGAHCALQRHFASSASRHPRAAASSASGIDSSQRSGAGPGAAAAAWRTIRGGGRRVPPAAAPTTISPPTTPPAIVGGPVRASAPSAPAHRGRSERRASAAPAPARSSPLRSGGSSARRANKGHADASAIDSLRGAISAIARRGATGLAPCACRCAGGGGAASAAPTPAPSHCQQRPTHCDSAGAATAAAVPGGATAGPAGAHVGVHRSHAASDGKSHCYLGTCAATLASKGTPATTCTGDNGASRHAARGRSPRAIGTAAARCAVGC